MMFRCLAACLCLLSISVAALGDDESPASRSIPNTSWFDGDAGELVPIHVTPADGEVLNRNSRWLPKADRVSKNKATTNTGGAAGGGGGGGGGGLGGLSLGNMVGWMLLVVLACVIVGLLLFAISKSEVDFGSDNAKKAKREDESPDEQTLERIKHLPAELRRTDVNLRTEAERLMGLGAFDQAIILLFGHQLLLLDRAGLLRLNRGKTNGKYVRETKAGDPSAATLLRETVRAFEQSYFGRHEIRGDTFKDLWRGNSKLEEIVKHRQEVAA